MNLWNRIAPYIILPVTIAIFYILVFLVTAHYSNALAVSYNPILSSFYFDGYSDLTGFIVLSGAATIELFLLPLEQKYIMIFFLIIAGFLINFHAMNWYILNHGATYGQSGVLMAMWGLLLGIVIIDTIFSFMHKKFGETSINLLLIVAFLSILMPSSDMFIQHVTPTTTILVNTTVHTMTFLLGTTVGILFTIIDRLFMFVAGRPYGLGAWSA